MTRVTVAWCIGIAAVMVAIWGTDGMVIVGAAGLQAAWCRGVCAVFARL